MLLEDLWQEPPICLSAFDCDPTRATKLVKQIGRFHALGSALTAMRAFAQEMYKFQGSDQVRRTQSNGVRTLKDEGPDMRQARIAQFERVGRFWVAIVGKYKFIAGQNEFPTVAIAQGLYLPGTEPEEQKEVA